MKKTSVFISLILRHKPEVIGITLDAHGWADVQELIAGINATGKSSRLFSLWGRLYKRNFDKARFGYPR